MARRTEYTIIGPPRDSDSHSPPSSSKSLPYRNNSKHASSNLRKLYRISAQHDGNQGPDLHSHTAVSNGLPVTQNLPPTPPAANNENDAPIQEEEIPSADVPTFRPSLVTPVNQNSPPTPDNTPPRERNWPFLRPLLDTQTSMTSTRAESFTTACENLSPAAELDGNAFRHDDGFMWSAKTLDNFVPPSRLRQNALPRSPLVNPYIEPSTNSQKSTPILHETEAPSINNEPPQPSPEESRLRANNDMPSELDPVQIYIEPATEIGPESDGIAYGGHNSSRQSEIKRGRSLRDRLLEAQSQDPSASTEKFADIIGWNSSVPIGDDSTDGRHPHVEDTRRFSGISTTSTIEAYVIEQVTLPRRQTTLRHVNKHESLRSVSSPLPGDTRNSMTSISDSPHRLVHKKARLSNQNRWSFGSEVSRSYSLASSAALPKAEVIRVAVIPERRSSLSSSAHNSQRQSLSNSSGQAHLRKDSDNPPSSWNHKRAFSESIERGREYYQPPVIPPRGSSLSAPTSRTTSRANSITSDHVQVQRQRAEKDLRKTLDRMESERLLNSLRGSDTAEQVPETPTVVESRSRRVTSAPAFSRARGSITIKHAPLERNSNGLGLVIPGSKEWAALRPPSIFDTPFSQPSFQSASPEINEAKAIPYFAHNNHSLQLIEPFSVVESRAVQEVQRQGLPEVEIDSPLRNPREPPTPPRFEVILPSPGDEIAKQLEAERSGTVKRPGGSRRRSESFMSSISRNLSLKNALNRKADQDLDNNLYPMWRPRAFWDDMDNTQGQQSDRALDQGIVNNSLGLPQERVIVTGPVSLMRRLSERHKKSRGVVKRSSHSSLAKIRASRQLHQSSGRGLRLHVPLLGVIGLQDRLSHAKQRKEDERRERRRAELRRSIGANVILQGDSRFPAIDHSLARDA